MSVALSHDDLVKRAVAWLKGTGRCPIAVPELVSYATEQPDAIGWRSQGREVLIIECKTSRADFRADRKKLSRRYLGAGHMRYYMTPPGLVDIDELPERWGLLEVHGRKIRSFREATTFPPELVSPWAHETMMYSLLRRVAIRGQLERCLAPKWGGDFNVPKMHPDDLATPNGINSAHTGGRHSL